MTGGDAVRDQYEAYPYPARDPADERRRLIVGSPSNLIEVDHYLFAGRGRFADGFHALVAGGGTGDAAIMLAQQLADAGDGRVTYVDLSDAAAAVARARAEARGLTNITFHRHSLLDLPDSGLGPFDYIDCCGVLHHLDDPVAGLAALVSVLKPGGGLGLMLYGAQGRTGVYPMQDLLRRLGGGEPLTERADLARRVLAAAPPTNWLMRNDGLKDHLGDDAGLVDLLLHPRDRAYDVAGIAALTASAGLAVTGFVLPIQYDPGNYVTDPDIRRRFQRLSWLDRCAAAETLAGNLKTHVFYAAPAADAAGRVASPDDARSVPVLHDIDGEALARRAGANITATLDGVTFRLPLPPGARGLLAAIDGKRSLGDIHKRLSAAGGPDWLTFMADWRAAYDALNGLGKLFLRRGESI